MKEILKERICELNYLIIVKKQYIDRSQLKFLHSLLDLNRVLLSVIFGEEL